jgi:hypothetical protein
MSPRDIIADNLARVRGCIARAAEHAGRTASDVRLVAVTKYASREIAALLPACGVTDIGESRPQELWAKADYLASLPVPFPVAWHLVGHLQRNKVRHTLRRAAWIQSVDSLRLLDELESAAAAMDREIQVLLEVNISGESRKHGFAPNDVPAAVERAGRMARLRLRGLMGMAGLEAGERETRRQFAVLRKLRDELIPAVPPPASLAELSMGMSADYAWAIAEGATIVRLGSVLFEGLK